MCMRLRVRAFIPYYISTRFSMSLKIEMENETQTYMDQIPPGNIFLYESKLWMRAWDAEMKDMAICLEDGSLKIFEDGGVKVSPRKGRLLISV